MPLEMVVPLLNRDQLVISGDGDVLTKLYRCPGAMTAAEAAECPGLPAIGEEPHERPGIYCRDIVFESADVGAWKEYVARVTYAPRTGNLPPLGDQYVRWSFGVISQRTDHDVVGGKRIGAPQYVDAAGVVTSVADPNASLGADILRPTIEADVQMPIGTAFDLSLLYGLSGRVNSDEMRIDGYKIPPGYALFFPVDATPTGGFITGVPLPGSGPSITAEKAITYRFIIAWTDLPTGITIRQDWDNALWTEPRLPIRYGIFPRLYRFDPPGATPEHDEIFDLRIFRAYRTADLNILGVR